MSEVGIVDSVNVDTDNNRVLVTVFLGPGRTKRDIPFKAPMKGMWIVPEIDDLVEVYESADGRAAASSPHTTTEYDMPASLDEGDLAITLNAGTSIVFSKNNDDTYNIELSADGNIVIDGIDFDEHTHDYDDDNGTSTTTKQTDPPN